MSSTQLSQRQLTANVLQLIRTCRPCHRHIQRTYGNRDVATASRAAQRLERLDATIDTQSLDATLQGHRAVNADARFRAILSPTRSNTKDIKHFGPVKQQPSTWRRLARPTSKQFEHLSRSKDASESNASEVALVLGPDAENQETGAQVTNGAVTSLDDFYFRAARAKLLGRSFNTQRHVFDLQFNLESLRDTYQLLKRSSRRMDKAGLSIRQQTTIMEYKAILPRFANGKVQISADDEPWCLGTAGRDMTGRQRLEAEISEWKAWIEVTEQESKTNLIALDATRRVATAVLPDMQFTPIGSQVTGLALPTSDLDLRMSPRSKPTLPRTAESDRQERLDNLARLRRLVKAYASDSTFVDVNLRPGRHMLVALTHRHSGCRLQIVISPSVSRQQAVTLKTLTEYPHLKVIYFLLKTILDMRGLSDVYMGGVGSYGLLNMIIASLRAQRRELSEQQWASTGVVDQLEHVARFWGKIYNPYKYGVDAATGLLFPKKYRPSNADLTQAGLPERYSNEVASHPDTNPYATVDYRSKLSPHIARLQGRIEMQRPVKYLPYLLTLQDQADPFNDLGRRSVGFKHIQCIFLHLHDTIDKYLHSSNQELSKVNTLLRAVLGRCDIFFDHPRAQKELFADGYLDAPIMEFGRLDGAEDAYGDLGNERVQAGHDVKEKYTDEQDPVRQQREVVHIEESLLEKSISREEEMAGFWSALDEETSNHSGDAEKPSTMKRET